MLRMEIALFLMLAFVGYIYVSAEKQRTPLHRTFSLLLVTVLVHLVFDGITVYTVNHLDTVPRPLDTAARIYFVIAELGNLLLPIHYAVTPRGNFSDGIHVVFCYISDGFYFLLGVGLLLKNWHSIQRRKKIAIGIAALAELVEQKLSMLYLKSQVNPHFLYTRSLSHVATLSHLK